MQNTISSSKQTSRSSRSSRSTRSISKKSLLLKFHHENNKKNIDEFRASTRYVKEPNSKRHLKIRHKLNELLDRPLRQGATQREKEIRKIKIEKYERLLQQYSPVKLKLKGGSSSNKYKKSSNKNKTRRFRR